MSENKNLTKCNLSAYNSKAPEIFRPNVNPKHSLIEPRKAQIDPQSPPNQKFSKQKKSSKKLKLSVYVSNLEKNLRPHPQTNNIPTCSN